MSEDAARVVIVDDHAVVRRGLRELVRTLPECDPIGEAVNGEDAIRVVDELLPDIVLMDISMPVMDGVEATRAIMARHPDTRVIMLTSDSAESRVLGALEAGAAAYVLKDTEPDRILMRIRSTAKTVPRLLEGSRSAGIDAEGE
ncbi:MAG: response regulator transcription factor [Candidatus Dormibacteraeota bacterium]|nr:response regulator transcription factor [Candidatus Dormibacteraeota bacterium]